MPSSKFRSLLSALVILGVVGPLSCTDARTGIFVEGVLATPAPECVVVPDPGATHIGRGTLDLAFALDYRAALLVGNQLTPRGDKEQVRTETMNFLVNGAEVELFDSQFNSLQRFRVPVSGSVPPNASEAPGFSVVFATLIPSSVGEAFLEDLEGTTMTRTVIAEVSVFGETLGGTNLDSSTYTFPIEVCHGCLVMFPLEAVMADADGELRCVGEADGAGDAPCRTGQDSTIDCRLCSAQFPVCQAP